MEKYQVNLDRCIVEKITEEITGKIGHSVDISAAIRLWIYHRIDPAITTILFAREKEKAEKRAAKKATRKGSKK